MRWHPFFTPWPELPRVSALALSNPEHLCPTLGTYTLGCRPPVLHGNRLGILHFPFGMALHAVCLHLPPPSIFVVRLTHFPIQVKHYPASAALYPTSAGPTIAKSETYPKASPVCP